MASTQASREMSALESLATQKMLSLAQTTLPISTDTITHLESELYKNRPDYHYESYNVEDSTNTEIHIHLAKQLDKLRKLGFSERELSLQQSDEKKLDNKEENVENVDKNDNKEILEKCKDVQILHESQSSKQVLEILHAKQLTIFSVIPSQVMGEEGENDEDDATKTQIQDDKKIIQRCIPEEEGREIDNKEWKEFLDQKAEIYKVAGDHLIQLANHRLAMTAREQVEERASQSSIKRQPINVQNCILQERSEFSPPVMNKRMFFLYLNAWDKASYSRRQCLLAQFSQCYGGTETLLDTNKYFLNAGSLIFLRFAAGFKLAVSLNQRVFNYFRPMLIFLTSINARGHVAEIEKMEMHKDISTILGSKLFHENDKLFTLYFLDQLLDGLAGNQLTNIICRNPAFIIDIFSSGFGKGYSSGTKSAGRKVMYTLCEKCNEKTWKNLLSAIICVTDTCDDEEMRACGLHLTQNIVSHLPESGETSMKLIFVYLTTGNPDILREAAELALIIMRTMCSTKLVKKLCEKCRGPEIEMTDQIALPSRNRNKTSAVLLEKLISQDPIHAQHPLKDPHGEQKGALYIVNYILNSRSDFHNIFVSNGFVGCALIALGTNHWQVQFEGIRALCKLNKLNFDTAATVILTLPDDMIDTFENEGPAALSKISDIIQIQLYKLGTLIYTNSSEWIEKVIHPTKQFLKCQLRGVKKDFPIIDKKLLVCSDIPSLQNPLAVQVSKCAENLREIWEMQQESKFVDYQISFTDEGTEHEEMMMSSSSSSISSLSSGEFETKAEQLEVDEHEEIEELWLRESLAGLKSDQNLYPDVTSTQYRLIQRAAIKLEKIRNVNYYDAEQVVVTDEPLAYVDSSIIIPSPPEVVNSLPSGWVQFRHVESKRHTPKTKSGTETNTQK